MQVSKLVLNVLKLAQVVTIIFIHLNLYKKSTKTWISMQLVLIALLDLTNFFSD